MLNQVFEQPSDCTGKLSLHQLAEALGNAVDARDQATHRHSWEVAEISLHLATTLGLDTTTIEKIHLAGHLHDIGKIGIPDAILKKPGALDTAEWLMMREHPGIGAAIVRPVKAFAEPGGVTKIILHHHERFDGTGYPDELQGTDIPLGARIIAVADTLSAMLQHRTYRQGTSFENACSEISRCAGSQFDPVVVDAFLCSAAAMEIIFNRPCPTPRTNVPRRSTDPMIPGSAPHHPAEIPRPGQGLRSPSLLA